MPILHSAIMAIILIFYIYTHTLNYSHYKWLKMTKPFTCPKSLVTVVMQLLTYFGEQYGNVDTF